jgi:hypothetical protein
MQMLQRYLAFRCTCLMRRMTTNRKQRFEKMIQKLILKFCFALSYLVLIQGLDLYKFRQKIVSTSSWSSAITFTTPLM